MRIRSIFWASVVLAGAGQLAGCAQGGMGARTGMAPVAGNASSSVPETATSQGGLPAGAVVLSGTCDAQAASYAVGQQASPALQSELITKTLAKTLRVVRPGEAVTQEFSSQRLNLDVDNGGRITGARCG